ncbi:hypothetical protein K2X92_06150, partial [Candidatus Gracilibacteria bacterium]|nr:hypothetical protein [Candidatus Gracilibacteria bacterium]
RIALITLAVAALAFIGSIIWIFATKNDMSLLPKNNTANIQISDDTASLEILRSQWKTEERIKTLEAKIDALSNKNNGTIDVLGTTSTNTGNTEVKDSTKTTNTGNTIIPISAKFLTKIISKVSLVLTKNNGIFGLYVFDTNNEYSTYIDEKYGLNIVASRTPYPIWMKNFQSLDKSVYTINESKTFQFPSFYVNSPKADTMIRLVMQIEAQTLLISLPKTKFAEFKLLMAKK